MIPQKAIDLILESEGVDQPWKWPKGDSGITIGYGYDLGYEKNFRADWAGVLTPAQISALAQMSGVRGEAAHGFAHNYKWITIQKAAALKVFLGKTLPHYEEETLIAFPGVDKLPPLAFGALVSLVYNRGSGMTGSRRAEMRAIRAAILIHRNNSNSPLRGTLHAIAAELRAMKHLWAGQGEDGLLVRRDAEADLVESAIAEPPSPGSVVPGPTARQGGIT